MKRQQPSWKRAAGGYRRGDIVTVRKRLPWGDAHTPRPWTVCRVVAVDMKPGNPHPLLCRAVDDPSLEDWFAAQHVEPGDMP